MVAVPMTVFPPGVPIPVKVRSLVFSRTQGYNELIGNRGKTAAGRTTSTFLIAHALSRIKAKSFLALNINSKNYARGFMK